MNILSLETSTRQFSLAISREEKILIQKNMILNGVLSSSIIPSIEKLLKSAKLSFEKIDGFVIGLGPGSFTSLRVGLSTVKALSFATRKPVVGIASLDALALGVLSPAQTRICALADARRNLVYSCLYENKKGRLKRISDYSLSSVKDLVKKINRETLFVGDGIKLFREEISKLISERETLKIDFAPEKFWYPQAKYLAALAAKRFQQKKYDDPDRLVPLYLYPDNCQVTR